MQLAGVVQGGHECYTTCIGSEPRTRSRGSCDIAFQVLAIWGTPHTRDTLTKELAFQGVRHPSVVGWSSKLGHAAAPETCSAYES